RLSQVAAAALPAARTSEPVSTRRGESIGEYSKVHGSRFKVHGSTLEPLEFARIAPQPSGRIDDEKDFSRGRARPECARIGTVGRGRVEGSVEAGGSFRERRKDRTRQV